MLSNRNKTSKTWKPVLINGILLIFAVGVFAGLSSIKSLENTSSNDYELVVYDSNSVDVESTQTIISSLMGADNSDNWSKVGSADSNLFLLNQLASEEATNRKELLKQSAKEMEEKLNALKMNIYPELNLTTYKESIKQTTTTSTNSKPVDVAETFLASGTITGTPTQIAEWEYLLSQSGKVNDRVKLFLKSVDGFKDPYPLTDEQRTIIEMAVMAESGIEPYLGVMAVAQCLREAAEYENMDPVKILKKYQWTSARFTPNAKVKRAVAAVFDHGIRITDSRIMFFYAPHLTSNRGHETMFEFVFEISKMRYFCLKKFGVVY